MPGIWYALEERWITDIRNVEEGVLSLDKIATAFQNASEVDPNLLRMLDRGLDDIDAGRTLPHKEAMDEVRRIRNARRIARIDTGAAVNV